MNILLINQPLDNRGDESAHKALLRALVNKISNIHITVLFVGNSIESIKEFEVKNDAITYIRIVPQKGWTKIGKYGLILNPYLWYLHPTLRAMIKYYKKADLILCAPGGICMGGFQNWPHLYSLYMAKFLNKKLAYYGRSFGPFPTKTLSNRLFKKYSLRLLNYFHFLSIRDKKTEKLAQTLNLKYTTTVDSAFLDTPQVDVPNEISNLYQSSPYIVYVPNLLVWHYAYKNKINKNISLEFFSHIAEILLNTYPDSKILMLPQIYDFETPQNGDMYFFYEIQKKIKNDRIIVLSDKYNSDIQQAIISHAQLVIGARYHSIVFAINNDRPFISLSYEHKMTGLLETLQKTDYMIDITEALNTEASRKSTYALIENKIKEISSDTSETRIKAKEIANQCLQKFIDTITK